MKRGAGGFSLIELLIVVVILAILVAFGYPNYREYVIKSKRTEAKAAVLKAATNQERFFLQNNSFSSDLTDLGFASSPYTTDSGAYEITVASTATTFTITATYQPTDQETARCKTYTIDENNTKGSAPNTDCWEKTR